MKTTAFIAASLDGFIARRDGDVQWLHDPAHIDENEDYGFKAFLAGVDALVMGRNTFEKVLTFDEWPYGKTRVIVMARRGVRIPSEIADCVESTVLSPESLIESLTAEGLNHLYIDGGRLIQSFIAAGLLNEIVISTIPRLLGDGIPLFGAIDREIPLRHVATTAYPKGLVKNHYEVIER